MEPYDGSDFYDDDRVFRQYILHRSRAESPNELIEKPIILDLLKSSPRKAVLDLGCGYGDLIDELTAGGVTTYTGIDASRNMINLARSRFPDKRFAFIQADITRWLYPVAHYDTVLAQLVFHYVADLTSVLANIGKALTAGGELICSVEHPVITSSLESYAAGQKKTSWKVDDYFALGRRSQHWMESNVVKYHRTVEEYWRLVTQAGFRITVLREGCPQAALFNDKDEFERRKRIPLFLILQATKL